MITVCELVAIEPYILNMTHLKTTIKIDCHGHGTHLQSLDFGIAKIGNYYSVCVLDCNNRVPWSINIDGLNFTATNIINKFPNYHLNVIKWNVLSSNVINMEFQLLQLLDMMEMIPVIISHLVHKKLLLMLTLFNEMMFTTTQMMVLSQYLYFWL